MNRVEATPEAAEMIRRLRAKHGELTFHQSGGCCDGSAPMCYPKGELRIGERDVKLGEIEGCEFCEGQGRLRSGRRDPQRAARRASAAGTP